MTRNEIIIFSVLGLLGLGSIFFFNRYIVTAHTSDIITLVLVLVTAFYAKRTADIANATKKQSEEIQEQRYTECLPLLVPDIIRRSISYRKLEVNEVDYVKNWGRDGSELVQSW